jgi:predicted permease
MVSVLLAIGAALLVLGCANVANVLMLRAVRTERDRAIRLALGASRARLVALQLTESAMLALSGALLGVVLAIWLKGLIVWLLFPGMPAGYELAVPIDERVLLMTLAVSMACGLFAGFAPALVGRRPVLGAAVAAGGGRSVTATRWLRAGLAGLQLALSLALVTGSLLLVTTLRHLHGVELGFEPSGASRHLIDPARHGYRSDRAAVYFEDLLRRLDGRPGFQSVALSGLSPFGSSSRVRLQDPDGADRPPIAVLSNNVSAAYFDVLRMRIVRGRAFTDAEGLAPAGAAAYPVVIGESLARRLFGGTDPIGRHIVIPAAGNSPTREAPVIGVAADVRWNNVTGEQPLFLYQPLAALRGASMVLVRSGLPLADVTRAVQAAAREIDPTLPVRFSQPLTSLIEEELTEQRVFAWMLSLLGWLAFALAAVGLYGLLAQSVTERTREFGIRMAIGSGRGRIFGLVVRQAAWIGAFGTLGGVALALVGTRLIEAQLYGVARLDPLTYAAAASALVAVVFAAAILPARAATRVQPVEALRVE